MFGTQAMEWTRHEPSYLGVRPMTVLAHITSAEVFSVVAVFAIGFLSGLLVAKRDAILRNPR